jgi:hypothetical protein
MSIVAQAWAALGETPAPIPLTQPEPWQVLAIANKHPYDDLVRFQEHGHKYALSPDGKRWVDHTYVNSVTRLLNIYVEKWNETEVPIPAVEKQRVRGDKMHAMIERYFNGIVPDDAEVRAHPDLSHEWACFLVFAETNKRFLANVHRTEWAIGDPLAMVVGALDCFVVTERHEDGSPKAGIVIDWKTKAKRYGTKGFTNRSVKFPNGESMTTLDKYETQAFLYARILKERYGIDVRQIMIVTFSEDYAINEYATVYRPGYSTKEYQAVTRGGPVHEAETDRVIPYYIQGVGARTETMSEMIWRMNLEDVSSLYEHKRVVHRDYDDPPNKLVRIQAMPMVIASSTPRRETPRVTEARWLDFDDDFENPVPATPTSADIENLQADLEKHTKTAVVLARGVKPKRRRANEESGFKPLAATPMSYHGSPQVIEATPASTVAEVTPATLELPGEETRAVSTLSEDWLPDVS